MEQFSFQVSTKVVFGAGSVTDVGSEAAVINAKHLMIVTDPGIVNAGLVDKVTEALELAKIAILDGCTPFNPRPLDEQAFIELFQQGLAG